MFGRAIKFFKNVRPLLAVSVLGVGLKMKKTLLATSQLDFPQLQISNQQIKEKMIRKILEKDVCDSKSIRQGQLVFIDVTEQPQENIPARTFKIAIGRCKGKLYAVLGHCTYQQPLSSQTSQSNDFQDAIMFNDKLYCPHHGCAFDIKSGTVQYGPATLNLPKFFVLQKDNKVKLYYPALIPTSVIPKTQSRDLNDLRKVVIIGGDNNATMGVIHGLKMYDYGGQITVIQNNKDYSLPYRDDLIHRKLLNLQKGNIWKQFTNAQIEKQLNEKLYSKLEFHQEIWYKAFGIQFIYNSEDFRVINKKYYPFVKFSDGTKIQFDGIVYCSGFRPKFPHIDGLINSNQSDSGQSMNLASNTFAPFYNRLQHQRMLKFLNKNRTRNMLVLGLNIESLQFIEQVKKQFPQIKVTVLDINKQNSLTQMYGPDIGDIITKQFTSRGVQMYLKVQQLQKCENSLQPTNNKPTYNKLNYSFQNPDKITNSIKIQLDPYNIIRGDCMVLFPNNTFGNTQRIKTGKFIDIDFNKINGRIIVDPNSRTDTKRMFAAGSCSSLQFFFNRERIQLINPTAAFEQGMTAGFNLNALNVPFHYIPFQAHQFFDKKILYAGTRKKFNTMYILGSLTEWDFVAFYALQDEIIAVSASPSRQKQFQIVRQSFRLQCAPRLKNLITRQWTIPLLYKLIRKIDKSGCYKDQIQTIDPAQNIPQVIWMDREKGSFATSAKDQQMQNNVEYDSRGYVAESS